MYSTVSIIKNLQHNFPRMRGGVKGRLMANVFMYRFFTSYLDSILFEVNTYQLLLQRWGSWQQWIGSCQGKLFWSIRLWACMWGSSGGYIKVNHHSKNGHIYVANHTHPTPKWYSVHLPSWLWRYVIEKGLRGVNPVSSLLIETIWTLWSLTKKKIWHTTRKVA